MKKAITIAVSVILSILIIGFIVLVVTEYRPSKLEILDVKNEPTKDLALDAEVSITTYDIGYLSIEKDKENFAFGGKNFKRLKTKDLEANINKLNERINTLNSDIYIMQEVDQRAKRTRKINMVNEIAKNFKGTSTYASNYKSLNIPYPVFNSIGYINSGLQTLSKFANRADRIALATTFDFPESIFMYKRCAIKSTMNIKDSEKKLVVYNINLEEFTKDKSKRTKQLNEVISAMREDYKAGNYAIAGGNFAFTFPNVDKSVYQEINIDTFEAFDLNEVTIDKDWKYSCDAKLPTSRLPNIAYDSKNKETQLYVIDGYLTTPNIEVSNIKTIDTGFDISYHNPVTIKIKLKK